MCERVIAYGYVRKRRDLGFGAGEVGAENDISAEVRCGEREPIGFLARLHRWHIVRQHQSFNASARRSFRRVFNILVIIQNICRTRCECRHKLFNKFK